MIFAQTRIHYRKWDTRNSLDLWDTNGSPNFNLQENTCHLVDFAVPVDHWEKKKREKNTWTVSVNGTPKAVEYDVGISCTRKENAK